MTSHSTLTSGLPGDDLVQSMEDGVLKKWGLYDALNEIITSASDTLCCTPQQSITSLDTSSCSSANGHTLYLRSVEAFNSGQYCDALIYLEDAMDILDGRHWTLKVKILNTMGDHLEALKTLVNTESHVRTFEILTEGAKALDKLGLTTSAERLLKKVVMATSKDLQWAKVSYELLQEIHLKRIYQSYVQKAPVKVIITEHGRGLSAANFISKGSIIFKEIPELCDQTMSTDTISACSHCGLSLVRPEDIFSKGHLAVPDLKKAIRKYWLKREVIPCKCCDRVVYCSEACRQDAWERYHKVGCPSSQVSSVAMLYDVRKSFRDVTLTDGLSWQGWWNAEFSPTLLAKLWAVIISVAKSKLGDVSQGSSQLLKLSSAKFDKYLGPVKESVQESIPKMYELMVSIFKRYKPLRYEITPEEFNTRHSQILHNFIQFHDVIDPLLCFTDKIKLEPKLYKKIGQFFAECLPRAQFHGLFPLASLLNHSCMNNAVIMSGEVDGRPGIWVKAVQDILEGQEIVVSYVSPLMTRTERRVRLWSRYKFICHCLRCEYEGDGPNECTHCGKKVETADNGHSPTETCTTNKITDDVNQQRNLNGHHCPDHAPEPQNINFQSNDLGHIAGNHESDDFMQNKETLNDSIISNLDSVNERGDHPSVTDTSLDSFLQRTEGTARSEKCGDQPTQNVADVCTKLFPHCGRCARAWYCSQKCQKEAWKKGHKLICKKITKEQ
ncbi:hypothetical protein Btru_007704 [Bulinus truncatus]|nr:hypothetical protein Btru_007704 [Bulinus truncatus]